MLQLGQVTNRMQDRVTMGIYRYEDLATETYGPEEAALLDELGDILRYGGSEVTIVPEIQRKKFSKNLWNIVFASFATLTGWESQLHFSTPS
jgi:2-dehydropantoate 2-reductase